MNTQFQEDVAKRFGLLPNFFRLASADPTITANLWGFAQFAYLDNPLPSLFKERLFVYLSRFCDVRYCIARHVGFLVGLGSPAGDAGTVPQTVEAVLPLLRKPLPHGEEMEPLLAICSGDEGFLSAFPAPDTPEEWALFACATHLFLQTPDATKAREALQQVLEPAHLEHLNVLLSFVRTAHYWTKLHPELVFEDDLKQLLATHEALAECILNDPEARSEGLSQHVSTELAILRDLKGRHESITQAYEDLHVDHLYVKHSLQATETNLRELVSVMPAAVYACDRSGALTYYNARAVELWGREPDGHDGPWVFLDSNRMCHSDGTPLRLEERPVREVLSTGLPVVNRELVLERPDGSRIDVLTNVTPLRDSAGAVTGAVNIFQDVTELKQAQEERERLLNELERSNRELSRFSFAVSHDLQAPVRAVRTLTQVLARRRDELQDDQSAVLTMIEQAADGMQRLIESLLQYAQAGQGEVNRTTLPVDAVIERVRVTLAPLIAESHARIVYEDLPTVTADPVLLEQLLQNLVANAIQYRRPEEAPVVKISSERVEDGWQFAVEDNGQGIPREYQDSVFEPLKRLHGRETPGTGLGLALCRTIVSRHGGLIWVESKGAGRGTKFCFKLSRSGDKSTSPKTRQTGA